MYIYIYTYIYWCMFNLYVRLCIYTLIYIHICVCVCLSHEEVTSASSFTFWFSQFHSHSQLSVSPCWSHNTKKTEELWIYAGITMRRWLSDVTVMLFHSFSDNMKCKDSCRQRLTLFWGSCREQRIMLTAWNTLIWLGLSCWLSASTFAAVWLLLKKWPKLGKYMKSFIWSIITVAVFCEATPCQLVRINIIGAA